MPQTPASWLDSVQVNPDTTGLQSQQQIIGLSNGNILVVFGDDSPASPSAGRDITGVIYDAQGNVVRDAFQVNFHYVADSEEAPSIAATNDGGFIIAYADTDADGTSIRAERHDAQGYAVDFVTVLADPGDVVLGRPSVAVDLSDNSFFVTYEHRDGNDDNIRGRKFDADMDQVGIERILRSDEDPTDTTVIGDPRRSDTAALANGSYVTVFDEGDITDDANDTGVKFRINNDAGLNGVIIGVTPSNGLHESNARVAALSDGGFVVVWIEAEGSGAGANDNVKAQRYEANGSARGGVITVTDTGNRHTGVDVIGLDDGSFFVAWQDADLNEIEGRLYDGATGAAIGSEIDIETTGLPEGVSLGATTDGRILVTYRTSYVTSDIHFEILDPRTGAITADPGDGQVTAGLGGSLVIGSDVSEVLYGQAGNDTFRYPQDFTSNSNVDTINGGGGVDTYEITNHASERIVDLTAGIFATGNITGAGGIRAVLTSIENVSVAGAQDVRGNASANAISASGNFDNDFEGRGGADTFTTGNGNDTLIFNSASEIGNGLGSRDVITDFEQGSDLIDLDDFDALTTLGGVQHFSFLGTGAHTGAGATLRYTHSGGNTLLYGDVDADGAGDFTLQINGLVNLTAADFTDLSIAAVQGSNAADVLNGTSGSELVIGLDGGDTLLGLAGADTMRGGLGADTMTGGGEADRFDFNAVAEIGNAANARDVIVDFQQGVDLIDLDGVDALTTLGGTQHFTWLGTAAHTGAGATLRYQQSGGNTLIYGDVDANGSGDFTIQLNGLHALTAADFSVASIAGIHGTSGGDTLTGMPGGKLMAGFDGDDTITGGAGADTIQGGAGFDEMTGAAGWDVFDFNAVAHVGLDPGSRDVIVDFQQGVDVIDLSGIDAHTIIGGDQAFAFLGVEPHSGAGATLRYAHSGGNTLVYGDVDADGAGDFAIELIGLHALTAADFVL